MISVKVFGLREREREREREIKSAVNRNTDMNLD